MNSLSLRCVIIYAVTHFSFYPPDRASRAERASIEYKFDQMEPTPWTPLRTDLSRCRLALVTTAGVRDVSQPPFEAGAAGFRVWPLGATLAWDFAEVERAHADADRNVLLPIDRLVDLRERRAFGELYDRAVSFHGAPADPDAQRAEALRAGRELREAGVHAALIVPATLPCNQTACLIAREIERAGVSTVAVVSIREVAEQVRPPRAVFLNFPFGATLGPPHATPLQWSILEDVLRVLRTAERPGTIAAPPYRWSA